MECLMLIFQVWTLFVGVLFLYLAWKTSRFSKHIISLQNLPDHFKIENCSERSNWPKIDVVIPACNEAKTLEAAMRSLLDVDYPNLEIFLVNDRSSDETGEIIERLSQRNKRITPVHITHLPEGWLGKVNALDR